MKHQRDICGCDPATFASGVVAAGCLMAWILIVLLWAAAQWGAMQ